MNAIIQGIKKRSSNAMGLSAAILTVALLVAAVMGSPSDGEGLRLAQSSLQGTERVTRLSLALMRETSPRITNQLSQSLKQTIDQLAADHKSLTRNPNDLSEQVKQLYFDEGNLDKQMQDYLFSASQLISAKKRDNPALVEEAGAVFVDDLPRNIIDKLTKVVADYQSQNQSGGSLIYIVLGVLWAVGLALIYLLGRNNFKPIMAQVEEAMTTQAGDVEKAIHDKEQAVVQAHNKERYLSTIIEEIRAPLHGVHGMINLLKQTNNAEQRRYYADKIENATITLSHLAKQVHDFSQAESGALVIEKKEFMVLQLIDEVVALSKPKAKAKQLQLFVRVAMDFPAKSGG